MNSVTHSPDSLPALEEHEPESASVDSHSPLVSPGTPHEMVEEKPPEDADVRDVASAFEGPSSPSPAHVTVSPAHVLAYPSSSATPRPAIHEEPPSPDYKRMSKDDVQKLKPNQLRNSLVAMAPDDYKAFQKKLTEGQRRVADDFFREVDEDTGITEPTNQHSPPVHQSPLPRSGPNKLRKNPPPGYVPPDYTEYRRLQGIPPRPGQGILSRTVELKTAKNRANGQFLPRVGATLDVATSPTALGIATKKTVKDVYGSGKDLIKKLVRRGSDEGNS